MKIKLTNKMIIILLLFFSFIPLVDLFHSGLPITHDGQDHVARIANFYKNLEEGVIIPRWAAQLNWGYGHPILMFLYPFPSYMASIFHLFNFSFVDSTKLVFGVSYVLSALTMLLWLQSFLKKEEALLGSILYIYAPYRFIDLYVRGAIGEHVAFIFPPLILYFVYQIAKRYSYWNVIGSSLAFAGLLLSHNAISLMFIPLILLYMIFNVQQVKVHKKLILYQYMSLFVLGFGLAAFFLLPAFLEGKYTLRDIVTKNEYASRFVNFGQFLYGAWNYRGSGQFTLQLGIVHWLLTIGSVTVLFVSKKKDKQRSVMILTLLGIFIFSLFLMTSASLFIWQKITLLQKFQFPWRLLSVVTFITATMGALVVSQIPQKYKKMVIPVFLILLVFLSKDYWHANGYLQNPESFFTNVYNGTTDTGESAPIWSVRFMEHQPKAHLEAIDGKSSIQEHQRTSTNHSYEINVQNKKTRLVENTLYFPGWRVFVDGVQVPLQFQDARYRGLMTFFVEEGSHQVLVQFSETMLRLLSNWISILSLVSLGIYTILSYRRTKNNS